MSNVHILNESGGIEASSYVFDIENTIEGDTLNLITENFEIYDKMYMEGVDAVLYGEVAITEAVDSIKQAAKKAWDRLVAWFKDLVTAIKKKIRGQFDNMSVEVTRKEDETKITFFKDVVGTIKTFTLDDDEKYEFIDLTKVIAALTVYNTKVGQLKVIKTPDQARNFTPVVPDRPEDSDYENLLTDEQKAEAKRLGGNVGKKFKRDVVKDNTGYNMNIGTDDIDDIAWSRKLYYVYIKADGVSTIEKWANNYAKNYKRIIGQIYSTSEKIDKKFRGKQGNRQAFAIVKSYRKVVNKLVRLNNAVVKIGDE